MTTPAPPPAHRGATHDLRALVCDEATGSLGDGPWQAAVWFSLPGRVVSKSNYRKDARRAGGWSAVSSYEDLVHQSARNARTADWPRPDSDEPPHRVVAVLAARTGLDAGNLSKSVLDACQGALYASDAQVTCLCDLVVPARTDLGLWAGFAALPETAGPADLIAAQVALLNRTSDLLADT